MNRKQHSDELVRRPEMGRVHEFAPVGKWRPAYISHLPPCNGACPAGENIQGWMDAATRGDYEEAWQIIVESNPFPAIHGRVCYHPCEGACNRAELDSTVNIHGLERFLGDMALEKGWKPRHVLPRGAKRVLIVGAGPCGLSAAYHLARMGHGVVVMDATPHAGGMMRYGIPRYRLPREVLEGELKRLEEMGVEFRLGHRVEDVMLEKGQGGFDAVLVAVGAQMGKRVDIPVRDCGRIFDAVQLLHDLEEGTTPLMGRRVAVYGGGNTAMDAARTARRLGADEAVVIYRRTRDRMPALPFEVNEAEEEGVVFRWLSTVREIDDGDLVIERMELDETGFPQPTGHLEKLSADALVLALGQETDSGFLRQVPGLVFRKDGGVEVDATMMTGCPGIFAGGDMVPAERSVTISTGHGKKAARHIDAWLRGVSADITRKGPSIPFSALHPLVHSVANQQAGAHRGPHRRVRDFDEVTAGLEPTEAAFEFQRCLSCGNCYECDTCVGACPESAITGLGIGMGYRVDNDRCTGCGVCRDQCPCGAIEMVLESSIGEHP